MSNAEEDEDMSPFNIKTHDPRFKFGTDMPNTVDLKAAIESCDILCKFALHYTEQANTVHDDRRSSELDPEMRANLQKIRYMNTTMLMGLQHVIKTNEKVADDGGELSPSQSNATSQERIERETSPVRFSNGVPPNELVHELAKVATSIFQLAIRIKAWVGMTPRERELDEEINTIRGKRCVLLDSTLAPSVVDQHGNVQKDWTVVPATSSTSKSYYERQRDLVQPRPSHNYPLNQRHRQQQQPFERYDQPRPAINRDLHRSQMEVDHEGRPFMKHGNSSSAMASLSTSHRGHSFKEGFSTSYSSDSGMSRVGYRHSNSSVTSVDGYSKNNSTEGGRNSKSGEAPYQKYRKRAKRTQPPGRCLSCDSSDTPEWRRGPDGARTLCNACGLHYAKLLKRQSEQGQLAAGPTSLKSRVINTRMEQLQAIALPLRKRNSSQTAESTPHADPSGSDTATPIATATGELLGPSGVGSPGIGSSGVRSSGAGPSEAGSSQAESLGVGASEIGSSGSESSSVQTEASSAPSSVGESDSYQLSESKKMADQDAAAVAVSSTENGVVDKELKKEG
ncbi:hypothetical protein BGZ54_003018 [Gamsiella multidivaricata]|nr:hypothetical protein BGZ54_003018 [Gamsiella multidivaricata]